MWLVETVSGRTRNRHSGVQLDRLQVWPETRMTGINGNSARTKHAIVKPFISGISMSDTSRSTAPWKLCTSPRACNPILRFHRVKALCMEQGLGDVPDEWIVIGHQRKFIGHSVRDRVTANSRAYYTSGANAATQAEESKLFWCERVQIAGLRYEAAKRKVREVAITDGVRDLLPSPDGVGRYGSVSGLLAGAHFGVAETGPLHVHNRMVME